LITFSNPPGAPVPASSYSQAALVQGPGRRLVISGQVGLTPEGVIVEGGEAQIALCVAHLQTILAAHGMGPEAIVKLTVYLTDAALVPAWRAARDGLMQGGAPASTLIIVAGLADPRFLVEVEAEAFAAA